MISRAVPHANAVDAAGRLAYTEVMAVSPTLLKQLLMLGERERVEVAHALLASVDDKDDLSDPHRAKLHAAIEQSLAEIDAGKTVPFADVIASLRAKRVARSVR
jgi:predicted transcriptional regulator